MVTEKNIRYTVLEAECWGKQYFGYRKYFNQV